MKNWILEESVYNNSDIFRNGDKFMTGNGYMGYRGTLEEYSKNELGACILAGLYDKVGDKWREPVNAPNGFFIKVYCDGEELSVLTKAPEEHSQKLNIRNGVHSRKSIFNTAEGKRITLSSERFPSMDDIHLMCMKYEIKCDSDCSITIETGIDGDVWDINGPHMEEFQYVGDGQTLVMKAVTHELKIPVAVAELFDSKFGVPVIQNTDKRYIRRINFEAAAGETHSFCKYVSVYTGSDPVADVGDAAAKCCSRAAYAGYENLLDKSSEVWERYWSNSDIIIKGDDEAQFALRYSIYQLLIISPTHSSRLSIPARGLSGQVYKGAIFWDTEMFMLPFFIHTNPELARNLLMYRYHTLDGARRKAKEYGFTGAFYAWESQETGDDACTHFNITDVFTGRPMRTYFRDKQIHISADIAHAIWQYVSVTGDESLLADGGAEVILECARFFYSYAYYKPDKDRFELLDVTGPDEYHEKVNNNAYTNKMVEHTLDIALRTLDILKSRHGRTYNELIERLDYEKDIENIRTMHSKLHVPEPDIETQVIEQFDGYHKLENISLNELKSRIINKNEYLGGGNGIATTTQILKQADVILMLNLFRDQYPMETIKKNWDYYEPRTEHGSSLSPCIYAIVAAAIGYSEWAYKYFLRTSTIDLTGDSKQFVGSLYIGGTHPAANGGAWMSAILGFAGIRADEDSLHINPSLPEKWVSVRFNIFYKGNRYQIYISKSEIKISPENGNQDLHNIFVNGEKILLQPGEPVNILY